MLYCFLDSVIIFNFFSDFVDIVIIFILLGLIDVIKFIIMCLKMIWLEFDLVIRS